MSTRFYPWLRELIIWSKPKHTNANRWRAARASPQMTDVLITINIKTKLVLEKKLSKSVLYNKVTPIHVYYVQQNHS